MALTPSALCFAIIKGDETCRLKAYPDPGSPLAKVLRIPIGDRPPNWWRLSGAPWTIGWGHTGLDVVQGLDWTQDQADAALTRDVGQAAYWVNKILIGTPLSQEQFDALVSLVFNIGYENFLGSTMHSKLVALDYYGAAAEFPKWCHAGGEVEPGLVKRRAQEQALFMTHMDPPPAAA